VTSSNQAGLDETHSLPNDVRAIEARKSAALGKLREVESERLR